MCLHLPLQGLIDTPLHKSGILGTDQNSRLQPVGQGVSFSENKGHQGFALVNGDFLRLDGSQKILQTLMGGEIIFKLKSDHQVSDKGEETVEGSTEVGRRANTTFLPKRR